jgi:imidazolonepropionase-like amidohydrolase
MLDVNTGTYISNAMILIQNGRVIDVGCNIAIPSGAHVTDLGSATILPGLIDAHTHLIASVASEGNQNNNYILQLAKESGVYRASSRFAWRQCSTRQQMVCTVPNRPSLKLWAMIGLAKQRVR